MGCGESKREKEARLQSQQIDEYMLKEKGDAAGILKLLLLGTGESGKTTILKQMKILHDNGFSADEVYQQRTVVYNNVITAMASLLSALNFLKIPLQESELEKKARRVWIELKNREDSEPLGMELCSAIKALWADGGIRAVYARRNEFHLHDSAKYFLDQMDRLSSPDYTPSTEDILHARVRTTGIVEVSYTINRSVFRIFDVGGQRSERKKWIHCFEGVNAIIFVTSLSEFNQTLIEDYTKNRMEESLRVFESVCNMKWFASTSIILFLNKTDLFREKIDAEMSIIVAFPEYEGPFDLENSLAFIEFKFLGKNADPEKPIFTHRTCATNTDQVKIVLDNCTDMIISKNLSGAGLN